MARAKSAKQTKPAVLRTGSETEEPGVWITQLKDTVNFGVRVYGSATKAKVKKAAEHFAAVKHFVDVEIPQLTAKNLRDALKVSADEASGAQSAREEKA